MVKGLRFTGSRLKGMLHLAAIVSLLIGIFVPFGQVKAEGALTVAEALQVLKQWRYGDGRRLYRRTCYRIENG